MPNPFKCVSEVKCDSNKPTILVIDDTTREDYSHIYGSGRMVLREMRKHYNIITLVLKTRGVTEGADNQYVFDITADGDDYMRKEDGPDTYIKNNLDVLDGYLEEFIGSLPKLEFVFLIANTQMTMPLTNYCSKSFDRGLHDKMSEYFDYIQDDGQTLINIDQINNRLFGSDEDFLTRFSPYAISTRYFSKLMMMFLRLHQSGKMGHLISFVTDPNLARSFFQYHLIPHTFYYFADDFRGTRDFHKLPLAQLQNAYEKQFDKPSVLFAPQRDKTVMFAGTILHEKGPRIDIWEETLRDYKDPHASYFIPLKKNGIVRNQESPLQRAVAKEYFPEIAPSIEGHAAHRGFLPPDTLRAEMQRHRYGLVFRCVSVNDSLTNKGYNYVANGMLPLYDAQYDTDGLEMPISARKELTFENASSLKELVQFYEDSPGYREDMIHTLRKWYNYDMFENDIDKAIKAVYNTIIENLKEFNS